MVRTFHVPSVPREVEKDGKKIQIDAPPKTILREKGPFLKIRIGKPPAPGADSNELRNTVDVVALIDTGASTSVITPEVADQLGLVQTGWQTVSSVHSREKRPVFYASLWFPWGMSYQTTVVSCNLSGGVQCLIGRDIMQDWSLTYNGAEGFYTICE